MQSSRDPASAYEVRPDEGPGGFCTCPDYAHRGGPCKHVRQVRAERAELRRLLGRDFDEALRRAQPRELPAVSAPDYVAIFGTDGN